MRTMAGDTPAMRMMSSTLIGEGRAQAAMPARSLWAGSAPKGGRSSGSPSGEATGRPMIGRTASMMSAASVVSVAPCLIRALVPAQRGSIGDPGTAEHLAPLFVGEAGGDQRAGADAPPRLPRRRARGRRSAGCAAGNHAPAAHARAAFPKSQSPAMTRSPPAGPGVRADRSGRDRRRAYRRSYRSAAWRGVRPDRSPAPVPMRSRSPASPRSGAPGPVRSLPVRARRHCAKATMAMVGRNRVSAVPRMPSRRRHHRSRPAVPDSRVRRGDDQADADLRAVGAVPVRHRPRRGPANARCTCRDVWPCPGRAASAGPGAAEVFHQRVQKRAG